jgi:hypothetical protein
LQKISEEAECFCGILFALRNFAAGAFQGVGALAPTKKAARSAHLSRRSSRELSILQL